MNITLRQLSNSLFRNRIKEIVVIQLLLMIPLIVNFIVILNSNSINYLSNGIFDMIIAVHNLLLCIEQFILKKKGIGIVFLILTILFLNSGIQSFNLYF